MGDGMKLEVLVSCMNEENPYSLITKSNIVSDVVVINQNGRDKIEFLKTKNQTVKLISMNDTGLTKSRNQALLNATNEICILCDDDVEYIEGYESVILKAFQDLPEASIIIFDIERLNYSEKIIRMDRIKKSPRFKSYGSVRIAFRRKDIIDNKLFFYEEFGAGSIFSSGEETIFLEKARNKGLSIFEYPTSIAKVDFSVSTWREGFGEKYFEDKGAMLRASYSYYWFVFYPYYIYSFKDKTPLSKMDILKALNRGSSKWKKLKKQISI